MSVDATNALLRWYESNRRRLPWRAPPGARAEPYRVWLSEIMLQQTTVAAVRRYFEAFTARWPTVEALAAAEEGEVMKAWAGLGYYARARNLVACAREVARRGAFPDEEAALRALPGIGRYTAAAVAAIAFGRRAVAVDANVERVVARLHAVESPLPAARPEIYRLADAMTPPRGSGDFAQAMMDLGATICTPRDPACILCPISGHCEARRRGLQASLPRKRAKAQRPHRRAVAYWLESDGEVLLIRRPKRGLLGGMLAFPTGSWSDHAEPGDGAPAIAEWSDAGSVEHVFTHFSLSMRLLCADAGKSVRSAGDIWWPAERLGEAGLPTLFAKLARRGAEWRMAT
ncbi:MAG TPA: A/G-specific adenine glycosylase [Allosphingosinicella sp.]|nr:A/G-specific adenine glycosylase [Allosphingosinicella sp.]